MPAGTGIPDMRFINRELPIAEVARALDLRFDGASKRRYLRLRPGIQVPRTEGGWDIIEFLRRWHGDKKAAGYVAHFDRQSEKLRYRPPSQGADLRSPGKPV
jgi:hypothetical protein